MTFDYSDLSTFPSHWVVKKIKEFAKVKGGKRLPLGKSLVPYRTKHPYIRIVDFHDGRVDKSNLLFVPDDVFPFISRYTISTDDVYLSIVGTIGLIGIVDKELDGANLTENAAKICEINASVDRDFLAAYLRSGFGQHEIMMQTVGSTQPKLALFRIGDIRVPIPPIPEQRAISETLGALDNKIELNRRMNATLESMARAVFQEMINTSPEGGEEKTIGDVVTIVGGSTPSTTNPTFWDDGDINWATPKDLAPLQSPFLLETNSWITELGLKEISSGFLPVGTVLLSSRAPIGYLAITQIPVAINQGFIAIKCTEEVPNYFILNWLKENMEEIIGRANGTTFLEISKSNFRPMKIVVPPPQKIKAFVEVVEPLYQKIVANLKESRTLASLRDSLLPKLMRGEVRVSAP